MIPFDGKKLNVTKPDIDEIYSDVSLKGRGAVSNGTCTWSVHKSLDYYRS